jgi:hypothetical protein
MIPLLTGFCFLRHFSKNLKIDSHEVNRHNPEDFNCGSESERKEGALPEMINRKTLMTLQKRIAEEADEKWRFN